MPACKIDAPKLMILLTQDQHPVRRLNKKVRLNTAADKKGDRPERPAVDPKAWSFPRKHKFIALLQFSARPGLKDAVAQIRERHCRLAAGSAKFIVADIGVGRILLDWTGA